MFHLRNPADEFQQRFQINVGLITRDPMVVVILQCRRPRFGLRHQVLEYVRVRWLVCRCNAAGAQSKHCEQEDSARG
jgi:hypothetical protein